MFIPDPDLVFFTHTGSRIQGSKGTGSRIWIRNTAIYHTYFIPYLRRSVHEVFVRQSSRGTYMVYTRAPSCPSCASLSHYCYRSFWRCCGSGIRCFLTSGSAMGKNQIREVLWCRSGMEKVGSGINIPDPQHWFLDLVLTFCKMSENVPFFEHMHSFLRLNPFEIQKV